MKRWILTRYLARQYLLWFLVFLFGLSGIIFLFEVAELLRRATDMPDATFGIVVRMASYKLPDTIEIVLPFVVLFSGMFSFWRLTRSQELIVARTSGVSAWQFLMPALAVTLAFGCINIMALNPLGARLASGYKTLEARYLQRAPSLELTGAGLWLRQNEKTRHYLLHADHIETNPLTLIPAIVFIYDANDKYLARIDAPRAVLEKGSWNIANAWYNGDNETPEYRELFTLKTTLTFDQIEDSMAPPNTISFWQLPAFIETLRTIGLPSVRHELRFHILLASPFLLCAMILFAAAFSLRLHRQGGILNAMMAGMLLGSGIFAANNVVTAMGANQTLPVILAGWAIPLAALMGGAALVLYREDG